jgi:glycosyltransferase involved in cell wall biosynthesis
MASALPKVAFGSTLLIRGQESGGIDGIGQYCQELLNQFSNNPRTFSVSPFTFGLNHDKSAATLLASYPIYLAQSLIASSRNSKAKQFFEGVDLIHATDQLIPIGHQRPLVSTVMDTIPLSHPEFIKAQSRFIKPLIWKKLTQQSDHIITISDFSKHEIANQMNFPLDKITSIPLAVDARYFVVIPQDQIQNTLKKYLIDRPFLLFIGSIQPRKNLHRILKAHASLPNQLAVQFPLVIAGKLAWDDGQTLAAINKGILEKRCIWLNYVTDIEKRCLLQATEGLVFTSLYEGFGLPILEAFASKVPVITSNCTSMPEVSGQCALLVNPNSSESIREGLLSLLRNDVNKQSLVLRGLERAKQFTWNRVAAQTAQVYQTLL